MIAICREILLRTSRSYESIRGLSVTSAGVRPGADEPSPEYTGRVLDLVRSIPAGKVVTYGDVAELLEDGDARQVGVVMARSGAGVPWWRVVNAEGKLPPRLRREAAQRYAAEGTAYDVSRERVNLGTARWGGR